MQSNSLSIVLKDNIGDVVTNKQYSTSRSEWTGHPMFPQSDPLDVNKQIIHYVNNSMAVQPSVPNTICYCTDDQHYNCSIDELGPVYPGQTYSFRAHISSTFLENNEENYIQVLVHNWNKRACKSHSVKDNIWLIPDICTTIEYKSLLYSDGQSCNIYLSGLSEIYKLLSDSPAVPNLNHFRDVYRITMLPCPVGFALNKVLQICQCDPILKTVVPSAESCNIDDQTILRTAGSWIIGRINTDNNYTYQVSSHCPFDYCLPHSSHLNLSNPDYQCQFNRTGVLCGRCKEVLSTLCLALLSVNIAPITICFYCYFLSLWV